MVLGAISVSTKIFNFDIYGDPVNTAARIARNNPKGVYVKLDDFSIVGTMAKANSLASLLSIKMDHIYTITQIKKSILITSACYSIGPQYQKELKGKGNVKYCSIKEGSNFQHFLVCWLGAMLQILKDNP